MTEQHLTDNISYLPSTERPLSADVGIIKTEKATWIFDVGLSSEAADFIEKIPGPKYVVLSHFHPDHILNLGKITWDKLFVSKNTYKYVRKGTIVEGSLSLPDFPEIKIIEIPSSHSKGCLALVSGDYAFLGDATYCKIKIGSHTYNAQLLQQMVDILESIDSKYFCLSHDKTFAQSRETVLTMYRGILSRKQKKSSTISVEDFFKSDGTAASTDKGFGTKNDGIQDYKEI